MIGRNRILIDVGRTFTRSDGSIVARIYERLTKASRRRVAWYRSEDFIKTSLRSREASYRRGVYDAYKALQKELS
jgi:DNA-directed RNA polymerase specialized sigma54-like protein